jgi:type I restriction enzyme, S subunit
VDVTAKEPTVSPAPEQSVRLAGWQLGRLSPMPLHLPRNWELVRLTSVARLESGHTPSRRRPEYWDGGIPWVSLHDSERLEVPEIQTTAQTISALGLEHSSARLLPRGTVVFSRTATVGKSTILGREMATSQDFANYVCGSRLHNQYLMHLFRFMGPEWRRLMAGSTHNSIYMPVFQDLQILLPPVAEQEAIAEALGDVDAVVESVEQLLAKKRQLKQATMQELLTGKRRLPRFSMEWTSKVLRNVIQVPVTDGPHLTPRFLKEGVPFLSVNNLVGNRVDLSSVRFISSDDHAEFSRKCRPQKGDVLLGKAASVGLVAFVDFDLEFSIWSPIALIRVNSDNVAKFVYYAFQTEAVIRQMELLTNSSSQGNLGMGDIERLVLLLPGTEEQQVIADILSEVDADIDAQEARLAKACQIRQGMMQELLTGRIRLA